MSKKSRDLIGQIERDLIDEKPLDTLLRKLVLLGGNAGSAELRHWASAELRGYEAGADLPSYRTVPAPLQIDGLVPGGIIRHEPLSTMNLPDFAQGYLGESVPLRMGVHEIQSMIANAREGRLVQLQPPGASDLMHYMNGQGNQNGRITALYWAVSTVALSGVLDQIRTRLAELIAELRSTTPVGQSPTSAQAADAVNVVINGHGNRVNVSRVAAKAVQIAADPSPPRFWTRAKVLWTAVIGFATIAGTVIGYLQLVK